MRVVAAHAGAFLVGFREDNVQILFGWREVSYDQILSFFGMRAKGIFDPQTRAMKSCNSASAKKPGRSSMSALFGAGSASG